MASQRAWHPTYVIPTGISSHQKSQSTGHIILGNFMHRACHPTSHVIPASMSSYLCYPTGHNRACHLTGHVILPGMASGLCHLTRHVVPLGILFHRVCHHTRKKLNYNLAHLSCHALIYYPILSLRWSE